MAANALLVFRNGCGPNAMATGSTGPASRPWVCGQTRGGKSLAQIITTPGVDASRLYLAELSVEMRQFDDLMRVVRRALIPIHTYQPEQALLSGGIDVNTSPFVCRPSLSFRDGPRYCYSNEGKRVFADQAQALIQSWGYPVLRRPLLNGRGQCYALHVLVDPQE